MHAASSFDCTDAGNTADPGNKRPLCFCHPSTLTSSGPYHGGPRSNAWVDLTLGTGISIYGGQAAYTPQFMQREGIVHLRGALAKGSSFGQGTTIATIPDTAACPPHAIVVYAGNPAGSDVNVRIHVETSCAIMVQGSAADSNQELWLSSISFPAANG